MSEDKYNGWTNRETWAVTLHVNNDEGLQSEAHDMARADVPVWSLAESFRLWVEDLLSVDYWRDEMGCDMPRGLELMRDDCGSLWRVNWRECAESLLSDVAEQEA